MPSPQPDSAEQARRRGIIHYTLKSLLDGNELQRAMGLWDSEFSQQKAFSVMGFLTRLRDALDLGDRLSQIRRSLTQNMFLKADDLGSSIGSGGPTAAPTPAAKPRQASSYAGGSSELVIFNAMLGEFVNHFADQSATSLQRYFEALKATVKASPPPDEIKGELSSWLLSPQGLRRASLNHKLEASALAEIIGIFYEAACDLLGPTATDRLFANAIRTCEQLPEASIFSPRRLM